MSGQNRWERSKSTVHSEIASLTMQSSMMPRITCIRPMPSSQNALLSSEHHENLWFRKLRSRNTHHRRCPLKVSRISVFHWSTFWWEYHERRPLSYVNRLPYDVHLNICLPLPAKPLLTTFGWTVPRLGQTSTSCAATLGSTFSSNEASSSCTFEVW